MSTMEPSKPLSLRCSVQNYDWGKIGEESQVARLFSSNSQLPIDAEKPYAEIWMGTHESGPSFVVGSGGEEGLTLKSWIDENPGALGEKVVEKWGRDLPFLFKVLSVAKALSIQAHPDKKLAQMLHKSQPSIYKDTNHKPEMALAMTQFEALCGFVSLQELKNVISSVPEIAQLVGDVLTDQILSVKEQDEEIKPVLQSIFTQLMSASNNAVAEMVSKMKNRLNIDTKVRTLTEKELLVLRLEKQYPNDVGVLSAFFLNYVKLNPGEALYLDANEPHAYLYGDCIECMATSDNVVRAGLTPKFRDVQTLCSMLTYKLGFPDILQGIPLDQYTVRYLPPFDEFEVDCCNLPSGASMHFSAILGPSIIIVTTGEGSIQTGTTEDLIKEGDVFFVPAGTEITTSSSFRGLQLYRAGVNSRYLAQGV